MKFIRLILLIVFLIAIAAISVCPMWAQPVPSNTPNEITGIPATIAAATTTNLATPIWVDFSKQQNGVLQFDLNWSAPAAAGLTNAIYVIAPSVTGIRYATNNTTTITCLASNAATTWVQALTAAGYKGYYLLSIQNTHATGTLTNRIWQGIKIGAP